MFDKYEIRTYPEYCIEEKSETDSENEIDSLPFKKATHVNENDNVYLDENENITPFLINKVNNKIDIHQNNNKKLIKKSFPNNYDSNLINKNNASSSSNSNSKRYKRTIKDINNKNGFNDSNPRKNLNKYFNITEVQLPKKSLKKYKNQFLDVEKSDNFKVLSYRPEDYETNYNKDNEKSKIIQLFKKQEASELFFPSKRAKSPPSPFSSANKTERAKDKPLSFYQTPTLKFQSFFGSFTRPKLNRNSNRENSSSKSKANRLEEFNIEKLIEIGDNKDNKWKNILSFGNRVKYLRNKNKMKKKKLKTEKFLKYKVKTEKDLDEEVEKQQRPIQKIELDKNDYNILRSYNNSKKVYHGQIKRKRNINPNPNPNQNLNTPLNLNQAENNIMNPQNLDNQRNNRSTRNNKIVIKPKRINTSTNRNNNTTTYINNNSNSIKIKKKVTKSNPKIQGSEFFYQTKNINRNGASTPVYNNRRIIDNNDGMIKKISPIKTLPNKVIYSDVNYKNQKMSITPTNNTLNNNKFHYSIKHFNNQDNNYTEKNKYMNYSLTNKDKNNKTEKSKKNMLAEIKEIDYNESNDNEKIEENKIDIKKGDVKNREKIKKIQNINNGGIKVIKNPETKDYKNKRYYGYDDRHNLEGTINNHSVYVSVYTKKEK